MALPDRRSDKFNTGVTGGYHNVAPLSDGYFLALSRPSGYDASSWFAAAYRMDVPETGNATLTQVDTVPFPMDEKFCAVIAQTADDHAVALYERDGADSLTGFRFDPATETLTAHADPAYAHPYIPGRTRATFPRSHPQGRRTGDGTAVLSKTVRYKNPNRTDFAAHFVSWNVGDTYPTLTNYHSIENVAIGGNLDEVMVDVVGTTVRAVVRDGVSGNPSFYDVDPVNGFIATSGPFASPGGFNFTFLFSQDVAYFFQYSDDLFKVLGLNPDGTLTTVFTITDATGDAFQQPFALPGGGLLAVREHLSAGERQGFNVVYYEDFPETTETEEVVLVESTPGSYFLYQNIPPNDPVSAGGLDWFKVGWDNYDGANDHYEMVFVGVSVAPPAPPPVIVTGVRSSRFSFNRRF